MNGYSLRVLTLTSLLGVRRGLPTAKRLSSQLRMRGKDFVLYFGPLRSGTDRSAKSIRRQILSAARVGCQTEVVF
jgi:hypothetical protein